MKKILLIVPTRNRPHNIPGVIESWRNTTSGLSDLLIVHDYDEQDKYYDILKNYPEICIANLAETLKLCPKLNYVTNDALSNLEFWPEYKIIGFIGDDIRIKTPGWEEEVIKACGEVGMAYPNDTIQGERLPTHIFMTSNIIKTLGYMVPPNFVHLYCDNFWLHLGTNTGTLKYMPDVIMEHYHPHVGKAESDSQYEETYARMSNDAKEYQHWLDTGATNDIEKIKTLKERVSL